MKDIDLEDTKSESIPVNLEDYLSHLYMWLEGMKGNQTIHYLSDDKSLTLVRNALDRLIKEITVF